MAVYSNRSREIGERLVKLRDYLYSNASPTHAVKIADMLTYLANEGYAVEIKTVYSDLKSLEAYFGLNLRYDGRQRGYLLDNPPFSSYDLRLIVNGIQAAQFITQEEADRLTTKMRGYADRYTRTLLDRRTFVVNRARTIDNNLMEKLDTIYEAIAQDQKISYKYLADTQDGQTYVKIDGSKTIIASPAGVAWTGSSYTAIVALRGNSCQMLPLDKMEKIMILDEKRDNVSKAKSFYELFQNICDEGEDDEWETKLKVNTAFISDVAEKFGDKATITQMNRAYFVATLNTYPTPELYIWTRKFNPPIEIIDPPDAEDELRGYFSDLANGECTPPPFP